MSLSDSILRSISPKGREIVSSTFTHRRLGTVHVAVRRQARRFVARWKGSEVYVTSPRGMSPEQFSSALESLTERLLTLKPDCRYSVGMTIACSGITFEIVTQRLRPDRVTVDLDHTDGGTYRCRLGVYSAQIDDSCERALSRALCSVAARVAPELLTPRARELAARVGHRPIGWTISRGHKVLGHCSARGVIALSYALVFLPERLRDYVIFHELAHLSEMNHSEAFHRIVDSYCGGCEKQLQKELKAFKWPIIR